MIIKFWKLKIKEGLGLAIVKNKKQTLNFINEVLTTFSLSSKKILLIDFFALYLSNINNEKKNQNIIIEIPDTLFIIWLIDNLEYLFTFDIIIINDINVIYHEMYQNNNASQTLWKILHTLSILMQQNKCSCIVIVNERYEKRRKTYSKISNFDLC